MNVPPLVQHLLLMLAATAAAWAGTDLVPFLNGQPGWGALAGTLVGALLGYVAPFVKGYGIGSSKAPQA